MNKEKKKKSHLIRPLIILLDIIIINAIAFYFSDKEFTDLLFLAYITFSWLVIAYYTGFYNVYRYTHLSKIITLIIAHFCIFLLAYLAYFSIFREGEIVHHQFLVFILILSIVVFFKFLNLFILKKYRIGGNNFRNIIVLGESKSAQNVVSLFNEKQDLGYRFFGFFSDKGSNSKEHLGSIKEGLTFALNNSIDEIYCEMNSVTKLQLKAIRNFSNNHKIAFKLIPENKAIYSKDFILEYYGTLPILKPKELPFERMETHFIKRTFDVVFSLTVSVLILSWLLPILWVLVKTTSKGPFFFKQIRDGINGKQFYCYKIRSMEVNALAHSKGTCKNDVRITKLGAFLRRTSLDELPQFFNVLFGDMSVIGPRPHMNVETQKYIKEIDNYLIRNSVKPGITGLAQISGYRGGIVKKSDIENRVRFDIFYIENWSFFLDIKIIFHTLLNVFKGQEKAY